MVGNMFFFFDSDDLMNSNCLTKLFNRAETLNLDIALCGYDLVDEHGKILKRYCENYEYIEKIIEGKEAIHRLLRKEISIWIGSQLLFTPGATHGEDQEFTLKALCFAKRVSYVAESLVKYVQRKGSATKEKSMNHFHYVGSMKRVITFFEEKCNFSEIIRLMKERKLPEACISGINSIIIYGNYSFKFIKNAILKNKTIKRELSNYVREQNTLIEEKSY